MLFLNDILYVFDFIGFLFMFEQPCLARQSASIAGQGAVAAYHPVTGQYDGQGIASVRRADGPYRCRLAYAGRLLPVAAGLAIGDPGQSLPYPLLEGGTCEAEGELEALQSSGEIGGKLLDKGGEGGRVLVPVVGGEGAGVHKIDPGKRTLIEGQPQWTAGGNNDLVSHDGLPETR